MSEKHASKEKNIRKTCLQGGFIKHFHYKQNCGRSIKS